MQRGHFLQDTPRGSLTTQFSFMMYLSDVSLTMTQANNRFVLGSTPRVFSWTKTKQSFQRTVNWPLIGQGFRGHVFNGHNVLCISLSFTSHLILKLRSFHVISFSFRASPSILFAPSPSSLVESERRLFLNHSQETECIFFQHVFVKPVLQTRKALLAAHCCW